ncbi:MAG: fasciclin domain-containing protein [Pseudomonadota bacterium]
MKHVIAAATLAVATTLAGCAQQAGQGAGLDIVDTAAAAGDFTTLVAAVEAADLVDALKSEGPFTVFAPTDAAFAALPEGTVETLLMPENRATLVTLLSYHVVPGTVASADLAGQTIEATTINGLPLPIDATSGVMVGEASVIAADIPASNGIIHAIDAVLMP